jgi:hypothetical protein
MSDRVGWFYQDRKQEGRPEKKIPKTGGNPYIPIAGCLYEGRFSGLRGIPGDYWAQLNLYARMKKAGGIMLIVLAKDVEKKLAFTNKDDWRNLPIKVYTRIGLCEKTLNELDEKARHIYSYTEKGELPPIPEEYAKDPSNFDCRFCGANYLCWTEHYEFKPAMPQLFPQLFEDLEIREV